MILVFIFGTVEKNAFKLPKDIHILYMGNSTIECAVNDKMLKGSYNMGHSYEHIQFVYAKLKILKELNPQIDTVILGFEDRILSKPRKNQSDGWQAGTPTRYTYIKQLSWKDVENNIRYYNVKWNWDYFQRLPFYLRLRQTWSNLNIKDLDMGGFLALKNEKNAQTSKPEACIFPMEDLNEGTLYYLKEIENYCKSNNITLIFIAPPKYKSRWCESTYKQIHRKYFKHIPLYDYTCIEYPDSCYADLIHLNQKGARLFSSQLSKGFDCIHSTKY